MSLHCFVISDEDQETNRVLINSYSPNAWVVSNSYKLVREIGFQPLEHWDWIILYKPHSRDLSLLDALLKFADRVFIVDFSLLSFEHLDSIEMPTNPYKLNIYTSWEAFFDGNLKF